MPFYREDLEGLGGCGVPDCERGPDEALYFHGRCHPDSPTWTYAQGDVLTIECARCRRPIASFVVASRGAEGPG